jgi:hypothetical protein
LQLADLATLLAIARAILHVSPCAVIAPMKT